MDERDRNELERIKKEHDQLRARVYMLGEQLKELEACVAAKQPAPAPPEIARPGLASAAVAPLTAAAPLRTIPRATPQSAVPAATTPPQPPPLIVPQLAPPELRPQIAPTVSPAAEEKQPEEPALGHWYAGGQLISPAAEEAEARSESEPVLAAARDEDGSGESSFEERFGTYWAVRIGIVAFLTGLVFLANLAYSKWGALLGPPGKIALLYVAGVTLLSVGWFLQRRWESLKNYGQVLMAGGLGAIYFTTYAAHYFPNLRVIESPLLAGTLLLGLAGFIVWLADRKKSQTLALFAIGLAYYTSIINRVELFTLFSNLVLTSAAVFFLVRNRWAALSFASLAATYGSYAYWRFFHDGQWLWRWNLAANDFWLGNLFLLGYWTLFTAAVFLPRGEAFAGPQRPTYLTLNNAALFGLVSLTIPLVYPGSFWKFSLGFGAVLCGLRHAARWVLPEERTVQHAYLAQGLLLVTAGFMTYFTGASLALVLALESVVLLDLGYWEKTPLFKYGAYVTAGISALLALGDIPKFDHAGLMLGVGIGASLVFFNAVWARHVREDDGVKEDALSRSATYFAALGLFVWLVATWQNTTSEWRAPLLAVEALLLTGSFYVLRLRELTLLAQGYLLVAQVVWLGEWHGASSRQPWWNPATVIGITLALSHWWQHQKALVCQNELRRFWQGLGALAVVGVAYFWLQPLCKGQTWLWLTSALAIGITAYGVATRAWFLAGCGQFFLLVSAWQFAHQLATSSPHWLIALAPITAIMVLALAATEILKLTPEADESVSGKISQISLLYRIAAAIMSLAWVFEYIPRRERFWVLALAGFLLFLWSGWTQSRARLVFGFLFAGVGVASFWFQAPSKTLIYLPNVLAILLLLVQQRIARRHAERFALPTEIHSTLIAVGAATLWLFITRWINVQAGGFYLTVAWAGLAFALFVTGLSLRESVYRRMGMAALVLALGRVTLDIWKLETFYLVISLMGLGVVLIVLGLIYSKFQDKLKKWL